MNLTGMAGLAGYPTSALNQEASRAIEKDPQPLGEVSRLIVEVRAHLEELHRHISAMEERLCDITGPALPAGVTDGARPPMTTPAGNKLAEIADSVMAAIGRIGALRDRIAI